MQAQGQARQINAATCCSVGLLSKINRGTLSVLIDCSNNIERIDEAHILY